MCVLVTSVAPLALVFTVQWRSRFWRMWRRSGADNGAHIFGMVFTMVPVCNGARGGARVFSAFGTRFCVAIALTGGWHVGSHFDWFPCSVSIQLRKCGINKFLVKWDIYFIHLILIKLFEINLIHGKQIWLNGGYLKFPWESGFPDKSKFWLYRRSSIWWALHRSSWGLSMPLMPRFYWPSVVHHWRVVTLCIAAGQASGSTVLCASFTLPIKTNAVPSVLFFPLGSCILNPFESSLKDLRSTFTGSTRNKVPTVDPTPPHRTGQILRLCWR